MKERCILTIFLVLIIVSCKNNKPSINSTNSSELSISNQKTNDNTFEEKKDSILNQLQPKNIFEVLDKITKKKNLTDADYSNITHFLLKNKDESLSEEVGYSLFEFLKGNESINRNYLSFLGKNGNIYKEKVLECLVKIMCIDLGDDAYTYKRLLKEFPIFKGSLLAQKAFNECISNQVQ